MPSNIQHEPIEDIKLGINTVSKGYIGHEQIYPNSRALASAAYTDTSAVSSDGGTRYLRVTGEEGSQYTLSGAVSGTFSLGPTYTNHSVGIGYQGCGTSSRTVGSVTLTPVSPTVISGGASSISRSLTQYGGGAIRNWNSNFSWSINNTNKVTSVQNGVTKWATGSTWTITITGTLPSLSPQYAIIIGGMAGWAYCSVTRTSPSSSLWQPAFQGTAFSATWNIEVTTTYPNQFRASFSPSVPFSVSGCDRIDNATSTTSSGGVLYP